MVDERVGEQRQLLAQTPHVDVNGPRAARVFVSPDVGQQRVARQDPPAVGQQVLEQQELLGRQRRRLAVDNDRVPLGVDDDAAVTELTGRRRLPRRRRRSSARTRATSSFGLNGLAM